MLGGVLRDGGCREDDATPRNSGKRENDAAGVSGDSGSRAGQGRAGCFKLTPYED